MIVRPAIPLALDRLWRETFSPSDRALRLADDLTDATAQITLCQARHRPVVSDWWYGETGSVLLGTDTGEIVNDNAKLMVTARIKPGLYKLTGEYTQSGTTVPFIVGMLRMTDYASQLELLPVGEV